MIKKDINISIIDCNHGFFTPEQDMSDRLSFDGRKINLRIHNFNENSSQKDVIEKCYDADIIVVQRFKVNNSLVEKMPQCRVVSRYGVGLDNIYITGDLRKKIGIVNFPTFCTVEVSSHAISLILYMYRRLDCIFSEKNLSTHWGKPGLLGGVKSPGDTTMGIIGVGRIGSLVALGLMSLGFNVIAYDPYVSSVSGVNMVDLPEIFVKSDILTIHCPLNEETEGMIDIKRLKTMKGSSSLVNTSRGKVVNQRDLELALSEGVIRSACIDVCDPEPPNNKTYDVENLYITPHIAFYSSGSLDELKRGVIKESVRKYDEMQSDSSRISK